MTPQIYTSYHSSLDDDLFPPSSSGGNREKRSPDQQQRTCHLDSLKTSWSEAADLLDFIAAKYVDYYPVADAEGRDRQYWLRGNTAEEDPKYQDILRCCRAIREHEEDLSRRLLCDPPQILAIKNITVDTESGDIINQPKVIVDLEHFSDALEKIDAWLRAQYAGKLKHFPPYRFSFGASSIVGACGALAAARERGRVLSPADTMLADAAEEYLPILLEKRKQSQTFS